MRRKQQKDRLVAEQSISAALLQAAITDAIGTVLDMPRFPADMPTVEIAEAIFMRSRAIRLEKGEDVD